MDAGAVHNDITGAAHELAALIVEGPGDHVTRTLFSLIYLNDDLAKDDDPSKAYADAAQRGHTALASIAERVQPGQPVLHITTDNEVTVGVVAEDGALIAVLPRVTNNRMRDDNSVGSIDLLLTNALSANAEKPFVKTRVVGESLVRLIESERRYNIGRLLQAGENTDWLVIGNDAIAKKLESANPMGQFVAMTALKAANVEVDFVLGEDAHAETAAILVALITYQATGELVSIHKKPGEMISPTQDRSLIDGVQFSLETVEDQGELEAELEILRKNAGGRDIRNMALALGLNKEAIKTRIDVLLKDLAANGDRAFFDPVTYAESLHRTLTSIFDT